MPVVLLAHGSRHHQGVAAIDRIRDRVAALAGDTTEGPVEAHTGYLDLNQPDLTATAHRIVAAGHPEAIVVPLLFTPAFHARTDVPAATRDAEQATGLRLPTADILGTGDDVLPLLEAALTAAAIGPGELLLTSVGSSNADANARVADLADRLARRRGAAVRTGFATCAPRAEQLIVEHPRLVGVLPLFVGPGLLLDNVAAVAGERGIAVAAPLETALAPLILDRYAAAAAGSI